MENQEVKAAETQSDEQKAEALQHPEAATLEAASKAFAESQEAKEAQPNPVEALALALTAKEPFVLAINSAMGVQIFAGGHLTAELGLVAMAELQLKDRFLNNRS